MRVYVNNESVYLLPGMTVRHALIQADLFKRLDEGQQVYDEWGNEIGLDGAISDGEKIIIK